MVYFMLIASTPITKKFKLQENITSLAYIKINQKNSIKTKLSTYFFGLHQNNTKVLFDLY